MQLFRSRAIIGEPSLETPNSQACTAGQFQSPIYAYWCRRICEVPRHHRKQWEFVYIAHVLAKRAMLIPGSRGLGFGVGQEPLPAAFASYGCEILATDLQTDDAAKAGWAATNQHAERDTMRWEGLCDRADFERLVRFEHADMNDIPARYRGFDFTWSACSLEHLGSIEKGLAFIENSLHTLRTGGVAVHTTELNCDSDTDTIDHEGTVLFRKSDFQKFARQMQKKGHGVAPLNFNLGSQELDRHIDVPPYSSDRHLKLKLGKFATTSFGIVVTKG
jgi:2-polyprenyl-3-methyl-5-hydroxy-6-metoxy-1,4-benzoquinol methylase